MFAVFSDEMEVIVAVSSKVAARIAAFQIDASCNGSCKRNLSTALKTHHPMPDRRKSCFAHPARSNSPPPMDIDLTRTFLQIVRTGSLVKARVMSTYLEQRVLERVPDAQEFSYPVFAVYPRVDTARCAGIARRAASTRQQRRPHITTGRASVYIRRRL
jgi:hypothetical protein